MSLSVHPPHDRVGHDMRVGRVGSVLGACLVLVHLAGALPGGGHPAEFISAHLLMAIACLPCVVCLWVCPSETAWAMSFTTATAMLVMHVAMMPAVPGSGGHHGGDARGDIDVLASSALALVVLEVGLAVWVLAVSQIERENMPYPL